MTKRSRKVVAKTIISMRIPTDLLKWVRKKAKSRDETLTQYIVNLLDAKRYLSEDQT